MRLLNSLLVVGLLMFYLGTQVLNFCVFAKKDENLLSISKVKETIVVLEKAVRLYPKSLVVNQSLALTYAKDKQLDKSLKYYNAALILDPENALLLAEIGKVLFLMNEYESAIENFNKSLDTYPTNIKARLLLAVSYHFQKEYFNAIENYKFVLNYVNDPFIWHNLSKAQLSAGKYQDAKLSIDNALLLDKSHFEFYLDRANINYNLSLLEDADDDYKKATLIDPQNPVILIEYAKFLWSTNAYLKAIEQYGRALELQPRDINILSNLAYLFQITGKSSEAEKNWHEVLDIESNNQAALFNLGRLFQDNKNYAEAVDLYKKLDILNLQDEIKRKLNLNLAFCYQKNNQFEDARIIYENILNQNPSDSEVNYKYAVLLMENKNHSKAISYLKKSIELGFQDQDEIYKNLLECYIKISDFDNIALTYESWLKLNTSNLEARQKYADFLTNIGNLEKAIKQYYVIVELDQSPKNKYKLARLLFQEKEYYAAQQQLEELLKHKPDDLNALALLANSYKELNDNEQAVNSYKKIVSVQPDNYLAYFNLGLFCQKQNNIEGAINYFLKTIEINENYAPVYYALGLSYLSFQNEISNAVKYFKKYLEKAPLGEFSHEAQALLQELKQKAISLNI